MVYLANIRSESLLLGQQEFRSAAGIEVKQGYIRKWPCACLNLIFLLSKHQP